MSEFTDIADIETLNRQRIEGWWSLLGREPEYPTDTATAVDLLRAVEYLADHDTALGWLTDGVIPAVPRQGGRLAWSATNIVSFAAACEARRRWQPFSTIHAHKFTGVEKLRHLCEHEGASAFTDLSEFDLDALLGLLHAASRDSGAVEVLTEAVREKLRGMGVL